MHQNAILAEKSNGKITSGLQVNVKTPDETYIH